MDEQTRRETDAARAWLVVAVDGTEDGDRAVRYAAQEARRTGRGLSLVHVVHETVPTAPMLPLFGSDTLHAVGHGVLADAVTLARSLVGEDVEVESHLVEGPRASRIIGLAGPAAIVLGPRASAFQRLLTGSTTAEVAAHAHGPVICVPRDWQPGVELGRVVVGVDGSPVSTGVLRTAFEAASERGARLTVLHAWRPSGIYEAAVGGRVLADAWERQTEPVIWELFAGLRADCPEVQVDVMLRYARPEVALAEEARHADLVVVGRRGEDRPSALSLGARARALIHAGLCPVEVAPVPAPLPLVPAQRQAGAHAPVPAVD
jgi:nucleotide-binding universal stress UspA family protein